MDDNMNNVNNGYDPQQYPQQGYDQNQYSQQGYDQNQYSQQGYDQNQYSQQGYDQNQYAQQGYDQNQYCQQYGYDQNQYSQQGYDQQQYSQQQYSQQQYGYDQNQYAQQGYDQSQYAQQGYDQNQYAQQPPTPAMTPEPPKAPTSAMTPEPPKAPTPAMTPEPPKAPTPAMTPEPPKPNPVPPKPPTGGPADSGDAPKKSKKGLIIGLSAAAVVVIAAVLLIFVFDVFGLRDKPEKAAERFLNSYAELDAQKMLDCFLPELKENLGSVGMGGTADEIQSSFDMIKGFGVKFSDIKVGDAEEMSVDEVKKMMKDEAGVDIDISAAAKVEGTFTMSMELMGQSNSQTSSFDIICVKKGSKWYVATVADKAADEAFPLDGDDNIEVTTEDVTEATTEASTEDVTDATTEEAATTAPVTGDGLAATYWTWGFDQAKWKYDAEKLRDNDNGSYLSIQIPQPDDPEKKLVGIEVDAKITSTYAFREDLYNFGIDEHDYVDGNVDTVNIGGVDFIQNVNGSTITYIARLEGANESIKIKVTGDNENAEVGPALESLAFNVKDIGNVDGPWYWEGEPFDTEDMTATVGSLELSAHFLKMAEPSITHNVFDHSIAYADGNLYILCENVVEKYAIGEAGVELQDTYTLDTKFSEIISTDDGRLLLLGYGKPVTEWKDGEVVKELEGSVKNTQIDPSGSYGISYSGKGDSVSKVTISGDTVEVTEMPLNECGTIMHANVSKNHIFLCGSSSDENDKGHKVFVYDANGTLQMTLTMPEDAGSGLGSITYVVESSNGFMGMDGNMRKVVFWDTSGNFIGTLEDSDLFGTTYPWFANTVVTPDGTIFTVMTEERKDKSAKEVLIYQISGF